MNIANTDPAPAVHTMRTPASEAQRATMLADVLRTVRRITPHRGRADVETYMREISLRYVRLGGRQLPMHWQTIEQLDRLALRIRGARADTIDQAITQLDHDDAIRRQELDREDARWVDTQQERDHQFRMRLAAQRSTDRNALMLQGAILGEGVRTRRALRWFGRR